MDIAAYWCRECRKFHEVNMGVKVHLTNEEFYLLDKAIEQVLYWDWVIQPDGLKELRALHKKLKEACAEAKTK